MKTVLVACIFACSSLACIAAELDTSSGAIVPGEWNSNFQTATNTAYETHIPALIVWGNPGCGYCTKLQKAMAEDSFKEWQRSMGLIMVLCEGKSTTDSKACYKYAQNSSRGYPYVCISWHKESGEDVIVRFTGRKGDMPVKTGTLAEQLMQSVENALARSDVSKQEVLPNAFVGGTTYTSACYDGQGNLMGVISLKASTAKKGISKVTGYAIDLAGKKYAMAKLNVSVGNNIPEVNLSFKNGFPSYRVALQKGEAAGNGVVACQLGGISSSPRFTIGGLDPLKLPAGYTLLSELLPYAYPFSVSGNKFDFGKNTSVKYANVNGEYELIGTDDATRPNLSGIKLTYTPSTGVFKGSFKVYATNEGATNRKPSLKKYTAKVAGLIVNGVGIGKVTCNGATADAVIE